MPKQPSLSPLEPQPPMTEPKKPCCGGKVCWLALVLVAVIVLGVSLYIIFAGEVNLPSPQNMFWPEREADETAGWQTYRNEEYGYSIKYPKDWTFRQFPDTKTGAGFSPLDKPEEIKYEFIIIDQHQCSSDTCDESFDEYVERAAIAEIQNYERLNSIEPIVTETGIKGYKTTWVFRDLKGKTSISLPITYFENEKIIQAQYGPMRYKSVQIRLEDEDYLEVYNQMLSTFKLIEPDESGWLDNPFSLQEIKVGDIVAGMKVESVGPYNKEIIEDFPFGEENLSIVFSGRVTIRGKFSETSFDAIAPGIIYFKDLDETSKAKIPKFKGDTIDEFLWFSNQEVAKEEFNKVGGSQARIIIDGFTINRYPAAMAGNVATLVEVLD